MSRLGTLIEHHREAAEELGLALERPQPQLGDNLAIRGALDGFDVELRHGPYTLRSGIDGAGLPTVTPGRPRLTAEISKG